MKFLILAIVGLATICNVCGQSGRIENGMESGADDAYAVTVYSGQFVTTKLDENLRSYQSTGVAVSSSVVIATGQAVHGFDEWRVGVNSHRVSEQSIEVVLSAHLHDQYDPESLEYNVAVLHVNNVIVEFLPMAPAMPIFPVLFAVGFGYFGRDETGNGILPAVSQQHALHMSDFTECRQTFNARVVRPTNYCGIAVAQFASGDQGAPVVDFSRIQVYGIVSYWNHEGVSTVNPVVLTDFGHPEIRSFIEEYL